MKSLVLASAAYLALCLPAFAEGDPEKGEKTFKKCKACHMIAPENGEPIVKGGKTGPNLFGVIGRAAAAVEGARYSKSLKAAGEAGLVWDEESLATYVKNPKAFLVEETGDSAARSNMTFKLKKGGEDIAAYLATFSPAPGAVEGNVNDETSETQ